MANQVTLTFAGETRNVEDAFDRVGGAARDMGDRVGESAAGFDRAGESADTAETRAQGFSDTLTGVGDIAAGTSEIMKGNLFEGFVTLGGGAADLAGGFAALLIPAFSSLTAAVRASSVAFLTSPVFWIIAAVLILIGVIVLIATKTDWFSKAWRASWAWIKNAAADTWEFLKKIPGWIGDAFSKVADFITRPYKFAFNTIARAWNATIGRLSWTVPGWVPFIGGNTISVPNLPTFHAGGRVPGAPGQNVLALLQAGETVNSAAGRGGSVLEVHSGGSALDDVLVEVLARAVRVRGGDVQLVLGASRG